MLIFTSFLRERKRERLLSSILDFSQSSLIINEQRSLIMRRVSVPFKEL